MAIETAQPTNTSERWIMSHPHDFPQGNLLMPVGREWLDISRVVILVPMAGLHFSRLQKLLADAGLPDRTDILLVGLQTPGSRKRVVRHNVTSLYTQFRKSRPNVKMQILRGESWQLAIKRCAGRNDLVACPSEEKEAVNNFQTESLSRVLLRALNLPVLELVGAYPPLFDRSIRSVLHLLFGIFPYAIAGVFFWMQYQIQSSTNGITMMVNLAISVIAELTLVFVWSLFLD